MSQYLFNYHQYKKRITKKSNSLAIIIVVLILLTGAVVYFRPKQQNFVSLNYVEINTFQTYNEAKKLSNELLNSNCYSYIYFDNMYHVLVSYHTNKSDAEKVASNLKADFNSVKVFTVEYNTFVGIKNLSKNQNSAIKNFIKQTRQAVLHLEKHLINYSQKKETLSQVKTEILSTQDNLINSFNSLISQFKTNSKYNLAKEYAQTIVNSFTNITNIEENEFESILRYQTINMSITLLKFERFF